MFLIASLFSSSVSQLPASAIMSENILSYHSTVPYSGLRGGMFIVIILCVSNAPVVPVESEMDLASLLQEQCLCRDLNTGPAGYESAALTN